MDPGSVLARTVIPPKSMELEILEYCVAAVGDCEVGVGIHLSLHSDAHPEDSSLPVGVPKALESIQDCPDWLDFRHSTQDDVRAGPAAIPSMH